MAAMVSADEARKRLQERQFAVKNIPLEYDEWKIFHLFQRFGLIDDVRMPPPRRNMRFRIAYVSMLTYEAADNVRNSLPDGQLKVDENVVLKVEKVMDTGAESKENNAGVSKNNNGDSRQTVANRLRGFGAPSQAVCEQYKPISTTVKSIIFPARLPYFEDIEVSTVDLPRTLSSGLLSFSVLPKGAELGKARFEEMYTKLQAWPTSKEARSLIHGELKVDDYLACRYNGRVERAVVTKAAEEAGGDIQGPLGYLVDKGCEIDLAAREIWQLPDIACRVPGRVIHCDFAGISSAGGIDIGLAGKVRELLHKICSRAALFVRLVHIEGPLNMVVATSVFKTPGGGSEEGDVASSLISRDKNLCYDKAAVSIPRVYCRDIMVAQREAAKKLPVPQVIGEKFADLHISAPRKSTATTMSRLSSWNN